MTAVAAVRAQAVAVLGALATPWSPVVIAGQPATHESLAPPQPRVIPLWPEGVPGAKPNGGVERLDDGRVYNVQTPTLTYYPPADGTSRRHRGDRVPRRRLCAAGDGQRGRRRGARASAAGRRDLRAEVPARRVRASRRRCRTCCARCGWSDRAPPSSACEPDRIGVFGASAGGHLAAGAATLFDATEGQTGAALDAISARPDFVALLYPVITMREPFAHADSRRNLLGAAPSDAAGVDACRSRARCAPTCRRCSSSTPPRTRACRSRTACSSSTRSGARGVPVEVHFYERGAHGFGMSPDLGTTSGWVARFTEWMKAQAGSETTALRVLVLLLGVLTVTVGISGRSPAIGQSTAPVAWARGIEGQRKADLGDGTFLNPILAGDHPDPSILKDGDDYYMTFSSFDAYPGPGDLALARPRQLAADRSRRCSRTSARCGRRIS